MKQDQVRLNSIGTGLEVVSREIRVVPDNSETILLPIVETEGSAWALVWPGMGAHLRSMHRISLPPGGRTIALRHPMEAVYYVFAGSAEVQDLDANIHHQLIQGGMVLVDPGTRYCIAAGLEGSEIVGGPCPADPQMYAVSESD